MSERFAANIEIGGEIWRRPITRLLKVIQIASVAADWHGPPFEPKTTEQLTTAIRDGHLFLCDDQSRYGEFPELEKACRELGLSYSRWSEGRYEYDAQRVDWRPGMKDPLVRVGSNVHNMTYVLTDDVRKALQSLDAGCIDQAKRVLRRLCPDIPPLPPFRIV